MLKSQFSPFSAAPRLTLGARLTSADTQRTGHELGRITAGLGLAATYGLALDVRGGAASLLQHALGTAFGLAAAFALAVPSLFVLLALVDAPVSPSALLSVSARALASTGFVLAGLAPSAALLGVTIESPRAASFRAARRVAARAGLGAPTPGKRGSPAQPRHPG